MPLHYHEAYRATKLIGGNPYIRYVAVGGRIFDRDGDQFCKFYKNTHDRWYENFHCKVLEDTPEKVVIKNLDARVDNDAPVTWQFEPLTLDMWKDMQEIAGRQELAKHIQDDDELSRFYFENYVLDDEEEQHGDKEGAGR